MPKRNRSSHLEVFLGKGVLKICSRFTGKHQCRSAISIKLRSNFIEIALRHECSTVKLLYISRTPFPKNTSRWLLLKESMNLLVTSFLHFCQTSSNNWQRLSLINTGQEMPREVKYIAFNFFF